MNKLLIYLIVIINLLFLINGQLVKDTISINSFELSETMFNLNSPVYQSTTFTLNITTINGMSLDLLSGGRITFTYDDPPVYFDWSFVNYYETEGNTTMISICVSHLSILACGIYGSTNINCEFDLTFLSLSKDFNDVDFYSSELAEGFPGAQLRVSQTNNDPVINSMVVSLHPEGPLITWEFNLTYYGSALSALHFTLYSTNDNSDYGTILEVPSFVTSNGNYYIEYLGEPGQIYVMDELHVFDAQDNDLYLDTQQIKELFNFSSISTQKATPIYDFFAYQLNNISKQYYANYSTLLDFDIYLNEFYYPFIASEASEMGNCLTWYQNSTFIKLFCTIFPGLNTAASQFRLISVLDSYQEFISSTYSYRNLNSGLPLISNITYSVSSVIYPMPLYVESNYTFETFGSYLKILSVYVDEDADGTLSNLVSGSISNGVVSVTWLLDPANVDMTPYEIDSKDSKSFENPQKFNGPAINTPAYKDNQISVIVYFNQTTFDLTSSSISTVPFLIFSTTSDPMYTIASSYVDFMYTDDGDKTLPSGSINHQAGFNGGLLFSDGFDNVYQTWASVFNSYAINNNVRGDINVNFVYSTVNSAENHHIYINNKCLTIIAPDIQPTMITNLDVTPQPVSTSTLINFVFETKGDNVDTAAIVFYQTSSQEENLFTSPRSNCSTISQWSSTELIAQFACSVQAISLPTSTLPLFFSIELTIRGVVVTIPNYLIRESGFESYVQLTPPQDYGVPTVTEFQTSFNYTENSITVNYNIDADSNSFVYPIEFNIIEFDQVDLPPLSTQVYSSEGQFTIELCQTPGFEFRYQNIGIYISIKSSINSVYYQFPSQILTALDPNAQNFTLNPNACDFSGPRLFDFAILNPASSYNTTSQSTNITVYFDITDDLSGFSFLEGIIKANFTNIFYEQIFIVSASDIISGNINNGRYQFDIVIPQYANGTYFIVVNGVTDNYGNYRPYSIQNSIMLSNRNNVFVAVSSLPDPDLPAITNIANLYANNQNNLYFAVSGSSQSLTITINNDFGNFYTTYPTSASTDTNYTYQLLNFNPNLIPGNYYFSVCLTSSSLSNYCFSWNELDSLDLVSQITVYNSNYE